jgi:hypothetical protein
MTASEWKVPRPSGVISSRDLARNTANLLTELKESEHSLLIVRRGLPTAVISSIPDPAWRPRRDGAEIAFVRSEMPYGPEVESDDEDALQVLEGLDLNDRHRKILEALSDGEEWVPDAIASRAGGVDGTMGLLGSLEISRLIVRRFGYYRIGKQGIEVLQALRHLDATQKEGVARSPGKRT